MSAILEVVAPVFIIVALGYVAAQRRLIDEAGFRGLTAFTFNLAIPALLFAGGTSGHGGGTTAAVVFMLACLAVYGLGLLIGRGVLRQNLGNAALFALNAAYGNAVMMGIPLIAAAFGQAGLSILLTILALHSMVLLSLGTVVAEIGRHRDAPLMRLVRSTLVGILRNPVVMAVMAGLAWSTLALPVPGVVRHTLEMLGAAAPPIALFCLGGSLAGYRLRSALQEVLWAVPLKLVVLPLLVWLGCRLAGLPALETGVAVTVAAMPTGANAFLLARRYALGAAASGATVLVSTMLSLLTLALVLGAFRVD